MSGSRLPARPKGERPRYFDEPATEHTLAITMALAGEVAVLRDRLDTIERLLESGNSVTRKAIDEFRPRDAVIAERDAWRERFLEVVLRSVHQEIEGLGNLAERPSYNEAIDIVTRD